MLDVAKVHLNCCMQHMEIFVNSLMSWCRQCLYRLSKMVCKNAVVVNNVRETSSWKRNPMLRAVAVADVGKVLVFNSTAGIAIFASICLW